MMLTMLLLLVVLIGGVGLVLRFVWHLDQQLGLREERKRR